MDQKDYGQGLRICIPTKPAKTVPTAAAIIVDVRMDEDVVVVDILRAAVGVKIWRALVIDVVKSLFGKTK